MKFKDLYMTDELYDEIFSKDCHVINVCKGIKLKFDEDRTCKIFYHDDSSIAHKMKTTNILYLVKKKNGKYKISVNSDKYKSTNTKCICIWETISLTVI